MASKKSSWISSVCVAVLTSALFSLAALAAGAAVYGTLQNAPITATFIAYRDEPSPAQILTQVNLGGGYAAPFWQLDTTNFSPEPEAGARMRVVFSDPASSSRLWERDFANPIETTNLGEIAESAPLTGDECPPPLLEVRPSGSTQVQIDWTPTAGVTYHLYHTATGSPPAGNGRYDLLQGNVEPPFTHQNPASSWNWYLLTPVDAGQRPLGCSSVGQGRPASVDVDGDCDVDATDIMAVAARWGCETNDSCYDEAIDFDGNQRIDIDDLITVATRWGCRCGDSCY